MTRLEDLLHVVPAQDGNGGEFLKPTISASKTTASEQVSKQDETTRNARRILAEEAKARAEKSARLKAARDKRDSEVRS